MSASATMERTGHVSPRVVARMAGVFWLLTFATGIYALVTQSGGAANLVATACYVGATLCVSERMKPAGRRLSLFAACCSLVGCAIGAVISLALLAPALDPNASVLGAGTVERLQELALSVRQASRQAAGVHFVFFGLHVFLVGVLVLRSTFLPRFVGALMLFGGVGWLAFSLVTLLAPDVGRSLSLYLMIPGVLAEGTITLWFLAVGVNVERCNEQAAHP